jgi:hypothetical protein
MNSAYCPYAHWDMQLHIPHRTVVILTVVPVSSPLIDICLLLEPEIIDQYIMVT